MHFSRKIYQVLCSDAHEKIKAIGAGIVCNCEEPKAATMLYLMYMFVTLHGCAWRWPASAAPAPLVARTTAQLSKQQPLNCAATVIASVSPESQSARGAITERLLQ